MYKLLIILFLLIPAALSAAAKNNPDDDLLKAAEMCDYNGIKAALLKGGYINAADKNGQTPLMLVLKNYSDDTSYNMKYNITRLLVSSGADVSAKDRKGLTSLDYFNADPSAEDRTRISDLLLYYPESSKNRRLIEMNTEPSYLCFFPADVSNVENISSSEIFEAGIDLPINIFGLHPSKNYNQYLIFVAKTNFRMYREYSSPIKTPSIMPRGIYYFWWNSLNRSLSPYIDFMYFSFMVSHHSNGQSSGFYTADGRVNTSSGNFSTNFAELSMSVITLDNLWINTAFRAHLKNVNREDELSGQYETSKVILSLRKFFFSYSLQVFGSVGYITTGRDYIQTPEIETLDHPAIEGIRARTRDNFSYQAQVQWRIPCFWRLCFQEDISLFAKYDYGYDYYNIHFQEKINRIQFGISGALNR